MEDDLEATCYHEAGHAVVAYVLGGDVQSVSLGGEADEVLPQRFGECRVVWADPQRASTAWCEMMTLLAGSVAERLQRGELELPAASSDDVRRATELAWMIERERPGGPAGGDRPSLDLAVHRRLKSSVATLHQWFNRENIWAAIAAVADELETHETLDNDDLATVLEFWLARS